MAVRTRLVALLATALVCLFALASRAASDWQVVKVNGWDYLSVENIAKFYGFPGDVTPINNTIRLNNGHNQLEVTLDSREAVVNGVRNWLCFPIIHRDGKLLVSRIDLAKTIEPQFRPQMIRSLGRIKTIVIDPGHGGSENGASSSFGREKDFTLDVARQLKPLLQAKGFNVVMTRERDEMVPLPERARIANATRDSIFVSIHFNATDANPSATGFEIYSLTPRGAPSTQDNSMLQHFANMQAGSPVDASSLVLSTAVYHAMLGHMPEFDRGIKRARFAVLRLTNIPAILVEGGFVTEREESRMIASAQWRAKLAQAISDGIDNYRGLVERKQPPMRLADYRRQTEGVLVARDATAPVSGATPPVFAASNLISAPSAQITTPVRREPSEQMTVDEIPTVAAANPPAPSASAPASISDEAAAEHESEDASATPNDTNVSAQEVAAADPGAVMPDATDDSAQPVEENDPSIVPPAIAPSPLPTQQPVVTRKYWILKFNPPPKFHE